MKLKIKTLKVIELKDWDDFVKEIYKRPYKFQQQNGCQNEGLYPLIVPGEAEDFKNDTVPEIVNGPKRGVSFKAWLERDPTQKLPPEGKWDNGVVSLKLWWERNFYPDIQMIANDLHSRGLLDAGEYYINIDW